MYSFAYLRPTSIAEAIAAASSDSDARFLAGGQTIIPTLRQRLAKPSQLIDLKSIADLTGVHRSDNAIGIGAMTVHGEVATNPLIRETCPAVAELAANIADPSVRSRGTIGGSLANNDPAADYPAAILALNATIVTNERKIAADDFFTDLFTTALSQGELITGIGFQIPEKAGYAKFEQPASRYALVGVFVAKFASGVRVAATGAGEKGVFRIPELEAALSANFDASAVSGISVDAKGLLSDLHGSAAYRAALIPVMAERAVAAAHG